MNEQNQQELVTQIYKYAFQLKAGGGHPDDIKENLIGRGLDATTAETIAENVEREYNNVKNKAAEKNMLYGGLWCAGGTLVTVLTYSAASSGGGHYVVAWGAIVFGAVQFFKGLSQRV